MSDCFRFFCHFVSLMLIRASWAAQLSGLAHLDFGNPFPQPESVMGNGEYNDAHYKYTDDIARHHSMGMLVIVQEVVDVEVRVCVGNVGEAEVQRKYDNQPKQVQPRGRRRSRDDDLEESKRRVESVLRDIAPSLLRAQECAVEDDCPEYNCLMLAMAS
jgi:hypothetical protein